LACLVQRMDAHGPCHASAEGACGDHIAAIGDVGATAPIVRMQVVGPDSRARILGDEYGVTGLAPVGECGSAGKIARNRIGLASPKSWLQNVPDGVVVCGRGRTDIHYSAASCVPPRVSLGLSSQASSQLRTFSDFTNLPTPSVCAHSKPSSIISSSLKCFDRSWYTSSLSMACSPCLNRPA